MNIIKYIQDGIIQECPLGHTGIYSTVSEICKTCAITGPQKVAREAAEAAFSVPFSVPDDITNKHNYIFKNADLGVGIGCTKESLGKVFKDKDDTAVIEIGIYKLKRAAIAKIKELVTKYSTLLPPNCIKQRKITPKQTLPLSYCMVKIREQFANNKQLYSMYQEPISIDETPRLLIENCFYTDI